ncbi:MAG TPA: glycine cleavage system protein GcvH [Candidatus Caenarcaniphilales bacterium]|nr:glycine cleavage system protein GcvH [Candidatus Caenarcaniphilales bacterium]
MQVPDDRRYTEDHEWLRIDGEDGVVGITAYAAGELGDVVFVELPEVGTQLERAQAFGVIESVKTASDLYSPLAGEIVAVNEQLVERPELVNDDPYGDGWMIRLRLGDRTEVDSLRDAASYRELIEAG